MNFSSYINWIINNPKNFKFVMSECVNPECDKIFYNIYYKDPDTGHESRILHFYIKGSMLIDICTNLQLAYLPESNLDVDKLNKLCKDSI